MQSAPQVAAVGLPSLPILSQLFSATPPNAIEGSNQNVLGNVRLLQPPSLSDEALLLVSRVSVIRWKHSSQLVGDLALRVQNSSQILVLEILLRGLKTLIEVGKMSSDVKKEIVEEGKEQISNKNEIKQSTIVPRLISLFVW